MTQRRRHWPRARVADVCESIIDCVNKTAPTVAEATPYKMIRTTNVKSGWVRLSEVRYVSEDVFAKWTRRQVPKRGDVILTREAPLGEVGMLRSNDQVFLGQRLVSYRADPQKLDNRFLLYAFQSADLQAQFKALGSGATVEHIRVPDCEKWILDLPPLNEQRRIASILSAYEDLIENNTRRIAILEEMARRLYEEWFVHFRFPGHEQARMVESELGLVPEGWAVVKLGSLVRDIRDSVAPTAVSSDTPYVGLEHIPRRSIALSEWGQAADVQSSKLRFRAGDILFGKIRPYFHKVAVAPVDGVSSSDAIVIRLNSEDAFVPALATINSDAFVAHAAQTSNGTKMPRANWNVLVEYPVLLPPHELRQQHHEFVTNAVATIRNLVMRNRNLRAQRDFLLPKLISGEIDVAAFPEPEAARSSEQAVDPMAFSQTVNWPVDGLEFQRQARAEWD